MAANSDRLRVFSCSSLNPESALGIHLNPHSLHYNSPTNSDIQQTVRAMLMGKITNNLRIQPEEIWRLAGDFPHHSPYSVSAEYEAINSRLHEDCGMARWHQFSFALQPGYACKAGNMAAPPLQSIRMELSLIHI